MIASYFEVVAIKDHKPVHQSQLLFKRGDRIIVVETAPTGWWKGEIGNRKGLFPESYVSSQPSASMVTSPLPTSPLVHTIITSTPPINTNKDESNHGRLSPPPHVVIAEPTPTTTTASNNVPNLSINKMKPTPLNNVTFSDPPSVTISIGQSGSPPVTSPSIESPKKSPRFNISPTDIANSAPRLTSHTRKNSGPSKTISSTIEDQQEFGDNDTSVGGSVSPNVNGKPKITYNSATVNVNHLKQYQNQQYPSVNHHATLGKPRSPIFGQPGRISVNDVNKEVPYYITRVIEAYQKSGFDELDINVGDLIVIYNKKTIDSDWWVGKLGNGFGVLPKKCVEIIRDLEVIPLPSSSSSNNNTTTSTSGSQLPPPPTINITTSGNQLPPPPPPATMPTSTSSYKYDINSTYKKGIAIATYNSQFATYLSFKKGDIMVLESKEGEFWKARIGNQVGLVSPNYIKEHDVQPLSYAQIYENNSTTPVPTIQTTTPLSSSNNTPSAAFKLPPPSQTTNITNNVNNETTTTTPVKLPTTNGNNHVNNNNNRANGISSSTSSSFESDTKSETDDDTIARKIRDSLSHFQTREELLEAVQNLAIKFVKQSSILKKEIQQEQFEKQQLQDELKLLKQKYNI